MIAIDMEMPLDCQECCFCYYVETRKRCGNMCMAIRDGKWLDGEYDKPKWCPLINDVQSVLQKQQKIIEQYQKADSFLFAHGWDWNEVIHNEQTD